MTGNPTTSRSLPGTEDRERGGREGRVGRRLGELEWSGEGEKERREITGEGRASGRRERGAREWKESKIWERG